MCNTTIPAGEKKTCRRCGETKERGDFSRQASKPDGLSIYCKPCWKPIHAEVRARKLRGNITVTTKCGLSGKRETAGGKPCLWETHPELAATLADPTEGWKVTKGTARKLTWKCPYNTCSETHEYRVPDKIIRGSKCSQCLPLNVADRLGDVQKNIQRSIARSVKAVGLDHCTTCYGVFSKELMAKGTVRVCKSCACKKHCKYLKDNPDVQQRSNAIRAKRARSTKGTFSREQWRARQDYFGNKCVYCGCGGKMTLDHKIPISKGGTNWPSNFVPACISCNSSKNAKGFLEFKQSFKKD